MAVNVTRLAPALRPADRWKRRRKRGIYLPTYNILYDIPIYMLGVYQLL